MPNKWIEDFNKEVGEALSRLKAPGARRPGSAADAAQSLTESRDALFTGGSAIPERLELSRLELAVTDMRRRLQVQSARLEEEGKSRDELQERISVLTAGMREADERTAALRRETAARSAHIKELEDTVELAERARGKLSEVLKEERANAEHWRGQAEALKARLDSVWPALEKKEKELSETLARYDEICRTIKEETGQRLKEVRILTSEAEKARAHEGEMQAQFDAQKRGLEEERERLHAQSNQAMENAEAIRRDAVRALEEARDLRSGKPPSSPPQDDERRALETELDSLRREHSRLRLELDEQARARAPKPSFDAKREKPAEPGTRNPTRYLLLAGFLAMAAVSAWLAHNRARSYPVPFSHPTGLAWEGDTLWVSDWYDESIYKMRLENGKLELTRRYPLPGVHIAGLAIAGTELYLVDSWSREIQRRKTDENLTLEASIRSPGTSPSALFYDGKYLWSADNSGAIYKHAVDQAMTVLNSYPGSTPAAALDADQERLWVVEARTRVLYAHRKDPQLTLQGTYGLKEFDHETAPLSCFARRGGKLWLGREGSKFLLELPAGSLLPRPVPR